LYAGSTGDDGEAGGREGGGGRGGNEEEAAADRGDDKDEEKTEEAWVGAGTAGGCCRSTAVLLLDGRDCELGRARARGGMDGAATVTGRDAEDLTGAMEAELRGGEQGFLTSV
jgi:hypothetical protein